MAPDSLLSTIRPPQESRSIRTGVSLVVLQNLLDRPISNLGDINCLAAWDELHRSPSQDDNQAVRVLESQLRNFGSISNISVNRIKPAPLMLLSALDKDDLTDQVFSSIIGSYIESLELELECARGRFFRASTLSPEYCCHHTIESVDAESFKRHLTENYDQRGFEIMSEKITDLLQEKSYCAWFLGLYLKQASPLISDGDYVRLEAIMCRLVEMNILIDLAKAENGVGWAIDGSLTRFAPFSGHENWWSIVYARAQWLTLLAEAIAEENE